MLLLFNSNNNYYINYLNINYGILYIKMILLFLGYYLEDLIFFFLHYTALIRTQITSQLSKYNFYSENSQLQLIKLFIEDVEENFKKYNQLTLIISLITFYYILRFNITSLVKMWFSLSKLTYKSLNLFNIN